MFEKLMYPRSVEAFIARVEKRAQVLAQTTKQGYYDELFKLVASEYEQWMKYRVIPKLERHTNIHLVNVAITLHNNSREALFLRLPIPAGSRLCARTIFNENHYCESAISSKREWVNKKSPLNTIHKAAVPKSDLYHQHKFYAVTEFALLRKSGLMQRFIDPNRMWSTGDMPWRKEFAANLFLIGE